MKHKHCELIKAWADGAEIQYRYFEEWKDTRYPDWSPTADYRIKPKTVKYRNALMKGSSGYWVNSAMNFEEEGNIRSHHSFCKWLGDWQEVEV